jgi:hypothetical protein
MVRKIASASLLPSFALGAFAGCGNSLADDARLSLIGTWEWVESSGGIAGEARRPTGDEPPFTVEFRADGSALFRTGDTINQTRRYQVGTEESIYHGREMPALYLEDDAVPRIIQITEDGGGLTLSENVFDGFSQTYRRLPPS